MFTTLTDYKTASGLAKIYVKKNGAIGVKRAYINQLISKEHKHPNTTDIDVIMVDGYYFAKQKPSIEVPILTTIKKRERLYHRANVEQSKEYDS